MTNFPNPGQDPWNAQLETAVLERIMAKAQPLRPVTLNPVYGDDFTSAALDAKWHRQGYAANSNERFQSGPNGSWYEQWNPAGVNTYIYQAAPAGDFTIVMRCSMTALQCMAGIVCVDDNGNGVVAGVYNNTDGHWAFACTAGAYVTGTVFDTHTSEVAWSGKAVYLKLRKSGTNYYASFSADGEIWRPETAAQAFAGAPTRIGFGNIFGTLKSIAVDFFDVQ